MACENKEVPDPISIKGKGVITFIFKGHVFFTAEVDKCDLYFAQNRANEIGCLDGYDSYDTTVVSGFYYDTCRYYFLLNNCDHHFSFNDFDTTIHYCRHKNHHPIIHINQSF